MKRMLIVEDDAAAAFGMVQFFTTKGYKVDHASSLDQATFWLRRRKYVAVFTDWALRPGGCEGEEVVRLARGRFPDIPVVVIAGGTGPSLRARALAAGANEVLAKPVALPALLAWLPEPPKSPSPTGPQAGQGSRKKTP